MGIRVGNRGSVLTFEGRTTVCVGPAFTSGGRLAGLTVTVTSACAVSCESLPVKRSTYTPSALKVAEVEAADWLANVTMPGPLTTDHEAVSDPPAGKPSSVMVPFSVVVFAGWKMVCAGPALTTGGLLCGRTVTRTSALPLNCESLAVSRKI